MIRTKAKSLTSIIVLVLTLAISLTATTPTTATARGTEGLRVAFCRIGTVSTHAKQILDGPLWIKAFRIEFNNRVVGAVVVTGRENPAPPPGYISGREYWSWMPGAAWPGTFTLVPVNTVPDYYSFSWETRSHENFDLSHTVPMPPISLDPGDRFYRVQVRNDSQWIDHGWMWLTNGDSGDKRVQEWYGQNLTSDLLGDGTAIRFTGTEPPFEAAPVHASQMIEGPLMIKAFRIEFNNRTIGAVVVTGRDNPAPPPGYTAGREYWSWMPGAAWPGTFTLVPVNTIPDYYSFSWETRSHEKFDLSRTVLMPAISLDPGDRFYRVQVRDDSRWLDQGWLWIDGDKRVQEWYGRNLTSDLLGDGTAIRFTSTEPPAPGSCEVYVLINFPTGGNTLDNTW